MRRLVRLTLSLCLAGACASAPAATPPIADLPASAPASAPIPQQEKDFIAIFGAARRQFAAARSTAGRQDARTALQIKLHQFLGLSHNAQNWIGIFKQSQTGDDGNLSIDVEIAPGVVITTLLNRFDDARFRTMIRPYGPLAALANTLSVGQQVTFDADLIGNVVSNDDDMVLTPRIIARFNKLVISGGKPAP
jgi:hypothetical protein